MTIMTIRLLIPRLQTRFNELVRQYMLDHKLNQHQISKLTKIGPAELNKILQNRRPLSAHYVNYPALTDEASWFKDGCNQPSPQALLPAIPAVDFRRIF